jgi:hypothetical protein
MDTTNYIEDSAGYGLTQDRLINPILSSIAATGFLIASYPVFVQLDFMTYEKAKIIVNKTFDTILNMQNDHETSYEGCLSHFVNKMTGKRMDKSEISTIDTAILVSGVISAAQYFGGDLIEKGNLIWSNVDFNKFETTKNDKPYIFMGISDVENPLQLSPWDYYAEQLMIYILGDGNPNPEHRISSKFYKAITKANGEINGISHIYSWFGSLFTYQFSQAFYNFKQKYNNKFVRYNKKYLYIYSIFYDCGLICVFCDMIDDHNDNYYTFLKYQLIYFSGKGILYDNNFEEITQEDYIFKINTTLKKIKENIYNKYETK